MRSEAPGEPRKREYTLQQARLIEGYKKMGDTLAKELEKLPDLKVELSGLIRKTRPPLSYRGVLDHYFFGSGRELPELVSGPIVRAFEVTPRCREEDERFLDDVRGAIRPGIQTPLVLQENFQEWVEARMSFFSQGLKRYFLDNDPLTHNELEAKRSRLLEIRWQVNHELYAGYQRKASEAAADEAKPRIFTPIVREQIQAWFDRGLDYNTVAELLRGIGVETSPRNLMKAVGFYDDLTYTLAEIKERERKDLETAAKVVFAHTGSRKKTLEIFAAFGIPEGTANRILRAGGVRKRVELEISATSYAGIGRRILASVPK